MSLTPDIPEGHYLDVVQSDEPSPYSERLCQHWFQTFSGVQFRPYDPKPSMILIDDIARSLSNQCRFTGHALQFESVAQHSVYVSYLVPEHLAMEALLHDATEAYVGDLNSPTKWGQPEYSKLEDFIWERAIAPRFSLSKKLPKEVKTADVQLLVFEKETILPDYGHLWGFEHIEVPDLGSIVPNWGICPLTGETRIGKKGMPIMGPEAACKYFLDRYWELAVKKHIESL